VGEKQDGEEGVAVRVKRPVISVVDWRAVVRGGENHGGGGWEREGGGGVSDEHTWFVSLQLF
jgi:hypothetical protein